MHLLLNKSKGEIEMARAASVDINLAKKRRNIKLVLEGLDFIWDEDELKQLAWMNDEGYSIQEMNQIFKREDPDEIFLALFHLAKTGRIKKINLKLLFGKTKKCQPTRS